MIFSYNPFQDHTSAAAWVRGDLAQLLWSAYLCWTQRFAQALHKHLTSTPPHTSNAIFLASEPAISLLNFDFIFDLIPGKTLHMPGARFLLHPASTQKEHPAKTAKPTELGPLQEAGI